MKILITGGAGFIGSHLADKLLELGHEVAIIDDLSTGSIRNIAHLRQNPRFHPYIDTIRNVNLLEELIKASEAVFHLAAAVGVKMIIKRPTWTIENNVICTSMLLTLSSRYHKRTFLASTSEVYGKNPQASFDELTESVIGPTVRNRWGYATSKLIDEFLGLAYAAEKGLPVTICRLFNTVGPRQTGRYGMVVPTFVRQAVMGQPITVYGDGHQTRCFTYIDDVVWVLWQLLEVEGSIGEIYNIGNPEETSINLLATKIREAACSTSPIVHIPYDEAYEAGFDDMPRRVPDISKLQKLIGFVPQYNIDQILERMIVYERAYGHAR